jgi:hypothetical protein
MGRIRGIGWVIASGNAFSQQVLASKKIRNFEEK